ncbi:MAG: hypothetical protein Q8L85_03140 [Alphaproteobacteria bacterium]|nr:hypothetical protein [Alphaproteobacteria bacterium]
MKKIVFIFLILFSNSSFGDKLDDFIQHLNQSIDQINSMHSKLQNHLFFLTLKDNEKAQNACIKYFGKFDVTEKEVGQLKDIFAFIEFIKSPLKNYIPQIINNELIKRRPELFSGLLFKLYAQQIMPIKKIEYFLNNLKVDAIELKEGMKSVIENLNFVQDYLDDYFKYILQFLQIECTNKKNCIYSATLNVNTILLNQKKNLNNIKSILGKMNLDLFKMPDFFKNRLINLFNGLKKDLIIANDQKIKINKSTRKISKIDILLDGDISFPNCIKDNYNNIRKAYSFVINPLLIKFEEDGNVFELTEGEIEENMPILLDMLQNISVDLIEKSLPLKNKKKKKRSKKKLKKTINANQENNNIIMTNEKAEIDTNIIDGQTDDNIIDSLVEESKEIEEEINIIDESPVEKCKNWLKEIMLNSSVKDGEFFSIFYKAHDLYKQLETHEIILLDQIQQAISELALRMQNIQTNSIQYNRLSTIFVPKNYEEDFLYVMYTPVCYLNNNVRFGFVKRLIEGLGGIVDESRSGSRISLHLNGQTSSLHVHDSVNGLLDGGRITSLREFFINAGVMMKD